MLSVPANSETFIYYSASTEYTPYSILAGASGTPDCLPGDCCHLTVEAERRLEQEEN